MDVRFETNAPLKSGDLEALLEAAWPGRRYNDLGPVLARSLAYVCAFDTARLIGFVNLAWDGGAHAFLLDPTVHPECRRRGIGTSLVRHASSIVRSNGIEWLHVDYEPHLEEFYRRCGFRPTRAGLMHLSD
jgi:ribosomal protein S18 acetylase RimI-like enzyme